MENNYNMENDEYEYLDELDFRVGFGRRLMAYIFDNIMISMISAGIAKTTGTFDRFIEVMSSNDFFAQMLSGKIEAVVEYTVIASLVTIAYAMSEVLMAATPGKMIFGICIANENRTNASYITLAKRLLIKYIGVLLSILSILTVQELDLLASLSSFVVIIGFFFVFGSKKQGFHDMFAKTAVFYKDELLTEEQFKMIDNQD